MPPASRVLCLLLVFILLSIHSSTTTSKTPGDAIIWPIYFLCKPRPETEHFRSMYAGDLVELDIFRICDTIRSKWKSHCVRVPPV